MASKAKNTLTTGQAQRLHAGAREKLFSAAVLVLVATIILVGWLNRNRLIVDPESGAGYALGIVGGSMMLILLGYPLRKRIKPRSKAAGSVGFWFRFHMLLGLLGPTAILFHSRFSFGSLNSSLALGAMIVVACSGLIGRFFYSRVHRGYSGRKLEVRALKQQMDALLEQMQEAGSLRRSFADQLQQIEELAIHAGSAFWTSARAVIGLSVHSRILQRQLLAQLPLPADDVARTTRNRLKQFFEAARRAAEFAFYERLLRLWHMLHLPLFILLVAAALLHIVAVHMY